MPDMTSPIMTHPHSARDRTTPLFEGLSVNSGYLQQKTSLFTQGAHSPSIQSNLNTNLFKKSTKGAAAMATIDSVPQSPVSTPNRKTLQHHRSMSPSPQRQPEHLFQENGADTDYTDPAQSPYEEFELFDTVWQVYWTEEGYAYYLDSQTQHSQWDDPRTHGILQYDAVTGEVISDYTSLENNDPDSLPLEYNANDDVKLALKQQDSFLQPKILTPNRNVSSLKQGTKRVQSMKPKKITANCADMSPFKTDRSDDDSHSDGDTAPRFSAPARRNNSRSSDEDNGRNNAIPTIGSRTKRNTADVVTREVDKFSQRLDGEFSGDEAQEDQRADQDQLLYPKLRRRAAPPKSSREIPFLSEADMAAYHSRRAAEDRELKKDDGGSGNWFSSEDGVGSTDGGYSDNDDEIDLSEAVSRMVSAPNAMKPLKTNCFSPDKASLARAERLQRVHSSSSSPHSVCSSGDEERARKNSRSYKSDVQSAQFLPGVEVLEETMQLESDNDDEDDFFDTIITMKKDELACATTDSADSAESDNENSSSNAASDYLKFLSKVEHDAARSPGNKQESSSGSINDEVVSLAINVDTSDWDKEQDEHEQKEALKSAEKAKQMEIFDTSMDGGYGNGGNSFQDILARTEMKNMATDAKKSVTLHVDTEFSEAEDKAGVLRPLQSGGDSPCITASHDSPNLEARVQPYIRFLEAGNSVRQVRRQMEKDNQSKELIKLMIQMSDDVTCTSTVTSSSSSSSKVEHTQPCKATPEELSVLKHDAVIGKYIKMASMGVPFGSVEQKMKSEGVSSEDMLRVAVALGHGPPPESTAVSSSACSLSSTGGSTRSIDSTSRQSSRRSSSVSLVKMHWNTVPADKLENSIWAQNEEDSIEEKEMQELEKLFAASGHTSNIGGKVSEEKTKSAASSVADARMKLLVLDARRAQNIVISLSQFKGQKSHKELLEAVCRLDDLNGALNIDKLQNLVPLLPTLHEAKKMVPAKDSQHPAEVFFNTAIAYFPELLQRLNCFITCLTFADTTEVLLAKMKKIIGACNEVCDALSLCCLFIAH